MTSTWMQHALWQLFCDKSRQDTTNVLAHLNVGNSDLFVGMQVAHSSEVDGLAEEHLDCVWRAAVIDQCTCLEKADACRISHGLRCLKSK